MNRKYDVLIIGAGVIGSAVAYFLSREKLKVCLLEKGGIGEETSSACDGFLSLQSKRPGLTLRLAVESIKLLSGLQEGFTRDVEYEQKGSLAIITSDLEREALARMCQEHAKAGVEVSLLSGREARSLEPCLGTVVLGASYCPRDGVVNPLALTLAFAEGAISNGVHFFPRTPAEDFIAEKGRLLGIITKGGERFFAGKIVLAAGIHTNGLLSRLNLPLPITPRRGQIIVTEPMPPLIGHALLSGRYLAAKLYPEIIGDATDPLNQLGIGLAAEQTKAGNILIGSTREFAGEDKGTTFTAVGQILKQAAATIPALREVSIIRTFAGLRPYTASGLPFISPLPSYDNVIVAAGHEGDGITLSAITGRLVKEMLLEEELSFNIEELSFPR